MNKILTNEEKEAANEFYMARFGQTLYRVNEIFGELLSQQDMIGFLWVYEALTVSMCQAAKMAGIENPFQGVRQ